MRFRDGCKVIISPVCEEITRALEALGIDVIHTEPIEHLIDYERYHVDMQMLLIDRIAFLTDDSVYLEDMLSECGYDVCICSGLRRKYPENVLLNAALVGNRLFCKADAIADKVRDFCEDNSIRVVDNKQGYSKCSTLVINENAVITADKSIYNAAVKENIDVLLITPGFIRLDDDNFGFIGGASGVIGDTVLFFGDVYSHPDAKLITEFIEKYDMNYISLCDGCLVDLGGLVVIDNLI